MKNKIKGIAVLFMVLVFLAITTIFVYVKHDSKTVEAKSISNFDEITLDAEDGFNLGVIGDSWVSHEKLDSSLLESLGNSELKVAVQSYSLPGRKSGEIFDDMKNENPEFNSNDIVLDERVDALLIVVGVNDTAGHFGTDYYVQNVKNIISFANSNNKIVYILEVPEYGIEEKENILSALKHNVYKVVNDGGTRNVIKDYRSALQSDLENSGAYGYTIIEYPEELDDYHSITNLYKDQFHLNDKGSDLLGEMIGKEIKKDIIF